MKIIKNNKIAVVFPEAPKISRSYLKPKHAEHPTHEF